MRRATVFLAAALMAAPLAAQPGAFELLDQVRDTYRKLGSYHDEGTIDLVDDSERTATLRFETVTDRGEVFFFRIEAGGERRVLRREGDAARLYDLALGQVRAFETVAGGLTETLEGGFDALVVPALLAGSTAALDGAEGAAIDGDEVCGDRRCLRLVLSFLGGTIETVLGVDRDMGLIRRVEVRFPSPEELSALAGGTAPRPRSHSPWTEIRVEHDVRRVGGPLPDVASLFRPSAELRLVEGWENGGVRMDGVPRGELRIAEKNSAGGGGELLFEDEITVGLAAVVLRVVDHRGSPVLGLTPGDFEATVRRDEVRVVSVDWVSSDPESRDQELQRKLARAGVWLPPPQKLVVFFVQHDLEPLRAKGQLRNLPHVRNLIETLGAQDLAAVVSFDSHLNLHLDFTRRHQEVGDAIASAMGVPGPPPWIRRGHPEVSLGAHLDPRAAHDAATAEQGLLLLARALRELPGDKVMVYLGWGLGRFGAGGVRMRPELATAVQVLREARTTVFVLDVTDADYHDLEVGIESLARETGGTYSKTHQFTGQVVERLARTISGHYILMLDRGDVPFAGGRIRIRLREKEGRVLVQRILAAG